MTTLPAQLMDQIFQFLDHTSLAKMAQVNKSWNRIVYRTSVWEKECWNFTEQAKITIFKNILESAPGARHYGEPTSLCFIHWLSTCLSSLTTPLPIYITRIKHAKTFLNECKKYWIEQKKPCKIANHFHIRDLLPFSYPSDFTMTDKIRLYHRLIKSNITYKLHSNVYSNFIRHRLEHNSGKLSSSSLELDDEDDPYKKYLNDVRRIQNERAAYLNNAFEPIIENYTKSIRALNSHSAFEFANNDTWFQKNYEIVWSEAAFSAR